MATLKESHIIPAFAFRWLRKTGLTSNIRRGDQPNKRVQDGWKVKMLCEDCEQRFGKLEKKFAEKIFDSVANDGEIQFSYDKDFHQLWTSIAWRYLVAKRIKNGVSYFDFQTLKKYRSYKWHGKNFQWAENQLKKSLIQGCETLEIHLFPVGIFRDGVPEGAPENINRHVDRAIELDVCYTKNSLLLYIKIGPFIVFANLRSEALPWQGSLVEFDDGRFPNEKNTIDWRVLGYIFERARNARRILDSISSAQKIKINESMSSAGSINLESGMSDAIMRDAGIFGIEAVMSYDHPV
jgi:hypothetical protein